MNTNSETQRIQKAQQVMDRISQVIGQGQALAALATNEIPEWQRQALDQQFHLLMVEHDELVLHLKQMDPLCSLPFLAASGEEYPLPVLH